MRVQKQDPNDSDELELSDDELENVAGGKGKKAQGKKATKELTGVSSSFTTTPGHKL